MRKTYIFLTLAMLGICTSIHAQITVTNTTFPAVGDTLHFAFDTSPNILAFTPPGGNQSWDFSSLSADFAQQLIFKSPATGTASAAFPGATLLYVNNNLENYLSVTNQAVAFLGYYGADPIGIGFNVAASYNPPIVEKRAPINFFDIHQISSGLLLPASVSDLPVAIVNQLPVRPDSVRIRLAINRLDAVDAWGDVTIPGGTYPVLREKRTQYRETRLDAKVPPLGWLDITDVAIQSLALTTLGVDTTVTYNFYNNTSKEPIAIVTLANDQATPVLVQYKSNALTTDVTQLESEMPQVSAFPNPASGKVQLRFSNMKSGQYMLKMYNILGMEVLSETYQMSGKQFETEVDVSRLGAGTYWYSLLDDRGFVLVTKQLVVGK
ncbi:MAG: T9SS type A sorting domain-containing protein [Saprospiraceae bacterium]|nr:T9SS type A sorting domain-containing protein [Saprospiraceae bacterium]